MNTSILQKCLAELVKETPDLSYIRGMLETLIDMQPNTNINSSKMFDSFDKFRTPDQIPYEKMSYTNTDTTPIESAVDAALASLQGMPGPKLGALTIEKNVTLN